LNSYRDEDLYQFVLENVDEIVYLLETTPDNSFAGRVRFVSTMVEQKIGYKPEEFLQNPDLWFSLMHPDDVPTVAAQTRTIFARRQGGVREYRLRHKTTGEYRWMEDRVTLRFDPSGQRVSHFGVARDITARKQMEETLRENTVFFQGLFEASPDAIVASDSDGRILQANAQAMRLFGYAHEELQGSPIETLIPDRFRKRHEEHRARFVADPQPRPMGIGLELVARRKDGSEFPADISLGLLNTNKGLTVLSLIRDITTRKQTEETLRESKEHYQELFEHANDIVYIHDLAGNFTALNQVGERITGYPRHEALTMNVMQVVAPEYRELARQMIDRKLSTAAPTVYELAIITKDGLRVPLEVSTRLIYHAGQPVGVQGIARDIRERQQAEAAIRTHAYQQAVIAELGQRALAGADLSTLMGEAVVFTAQALNVEYCKVLELLPDGKALLLRAGVGWKDGLVGHATLDAGTDSQAGYTLLSNEPVIVEDLRAERRFRGPSLLHDHTVVSGMSVIIAGPNRPFGVLGAHTTKRRTFTHDDIHFLQAIANMLAIAIERKQFEERRQEEAKVSATLARVGRELVASLDTAAILHNLCFLTTEALDCDYSSTILWRPEENVYVPAASHGHAAEQVEMVRALRIPQQAMEGVIARLRVQDVVEVASDQDFAPQALLQQFGVTSVLYLALRRGHDFIGFQTAAYRGGMGLSLSQKRIAGGITQLASLALENARLLEQAQRANQLKSDFLTVMSHELRTPLGIVMGYNDLLLEGIFGPLTSAQVESLQKTKRAVSAELQLLTDLLEVSRLETGRLPVACQEVDLKELLREVAEETQELLKEKPAVRLEWQVALELPPIYTDRTKLKAVLGNLLNNAVKFTDKGSVTVDASALAKGVEITVTDTGIGIAPEVRPILFEMFRQGESPMTRRHGGVGLGLYIVKHFLELLEGTVTVESEVGRGSTFRVWVPQTTSLLRPV
jgi:PAS domain S-box-containing protein